MPHDQNTGGFYLALIRKKNHVVFGNNNRADRKQKDEGVKDEGEEKKSNIENDDENDKAIRELDELTKDVKEDMMDEPPVKKSAPKKDEEDDAEDAAEDEQVEEE